MAVESRFVVIRQGVEVETFMDKKAADEYDKMLDMADNLSAMFEHAPVELSEPMREELSIYLAQHREEVLIALQAKKAKVVKVVNETAESSIDATIVEENASPAKKTPAKKTTTKKAKASTDIGDVPSDAA